MRAHAIADKQRAISNSYEEAHKSVAILRSQLSDIARRGNAEIRQIQASKDPAVSKVAKIVETVIRSQTDANLQAAICSDGVFGAIQRILDTDVADTSAREFANSIGLNLDHAFRSSKVEDVRAQVTQALDNPLLQTTTEESATGPSRYSTGTVPSGSDAMHIADAPTRAGDFESRLSTGGITPRPLETPSPSAPISSDSRYETGETSGMGTYGAPPAMHSSPAPATRTTTVGGVLPQPTSTPHSPTTNIPTPAPALSPEGLANNFNSGVHAGAPVSTGAEALSNNAVHTVQAQAPVHSQPVPPAQIAPTTGTPIFETSHAASTPVDTAVPTPPVDAPQTVIAAAPPPTVPTGSAPSAAAPAGPLPAYGADLRPAAAAPAGPPPAPMTAPGSAPVNPTATALNQPAVVRQQPVATPQNAPAGLTENAVAATAAGAADGAGAAHTQARHRLQRLLDFVARQEPRLCWAIGDREDGSTVLVTDLAGGWVPPHVRIPVGVTLLAPGRRTGSPTTLLGPTTLTATYSPGQYIAPDDAEPVRTSIRARQTADVEELGWELSRATKWRDGLPRLAHTLAKAASSGSGYLDSEIDLLNAHLRAITGRVLREYPHNHDPATVGNWQLLAGIGALINNERICANYHLAWFQAMSLTQAGEAQR